MNVTARTPVMGAGQWGCPHSLQDFDGRRNRGSRPGLSIHWGIACLLVALLGLTGCGTTDNPTATPVSPGEISAPPGTGTPAGGAASVRLTFAGGAGELPAQNARGPLPRLSVRADTAAAAFVVVRLLSLFPGQPATAALASRTVTVPVDAAGNASIEVSGLPVRPLVVRVRVEGATVAGLTDFQGAADLASGANAVTVQPTGSGLTHDLAAQVLLALAAMPDQVQFTPVALVTAVRTALASAATNLAAAGTAVTATGSPLLPTLAVQHLREAAATTNTVVRVQGQGTSLVGRSWTKGISQVFTSLDVAGLDPASARWTAVLPHGAAGAVTALAQIDSPALGLLSRLSVSGGERLAVLRHRGLIDTVVSTSDGTIVCGGRDGSDGRPVVWCWDGAIDAHTANATDGAAVGLRWAQPLADLPLPTGMAGEMPADGPRVVGLVDDGVGGLQVAVRPASAGTLRYLRLDTRRGAPLSGFVTLQASAGTGLRPTASRTVQISETDAGQVMRSLAVAVATATNQQLATVAADENRFAFDLYGRLRLTADGNLFVSPYSVWQALSMTLVGAADTTRQQMLAVLRHSLPASELHPAVRRLQAELLARAHPEITSVGEPFRLSVVNDLWGQREQYFVPTFLDGLSADYGAGLRLLDFIGNPDGSRSTINRYIASATYQRITDLLPPGSINVDTRVVLTNAVYFKAGWLTPFADNQTVPMPFTRLDGSSVTMNAMAATDSFRIATGSGRTIIELPYVHGELVMDVIVPDTGQFAAVESALDAASWASAAARLQPARLALRFPKWTHRWSQSLRDPLTAMGMSDPFGPAADFSGMNGTREFFIQDVVHQAFVGVDERGTEAAAATAVIIGTTSMPTDEPIPLVVDRPFIYLIRDRSTGAVLFMGRVLQP